MSSQQHKDSSAWGWHPTDEEVLQFLDGELSAKVSADVRVHLEGCWSCRTRREEIERSISAFMQLRKSMLGGYAALPPEAGLRFEAKLNRLAVENGKQPLLNRWRNILTPRKYQLRYSVRGAAVSAAICVLAFVIVWFNWSQPVGAYELVNRMQHAEASLINQVSNPVVYRKLRVRRVSASLNEVATWETWHDTSRDRFKHRLGAEERRDARIVRAAVKETHAVDDATVEANASLLLTELQGALRRNGMDERQPLSPVAFEAWHRSARTEAEQVFGVRLPDGGDALVLRTKVQPPSAVNQLVYVELVVRVADWHPLKQQLTMQGDQGMYRYELIEEDFQVVSLNALAPALFADEEVAHAAPPTSQTPMPTSSHVVSPAPLVNPPLAPAPILPSAEDLLSAELDVRAALHRLKADLGEAIEVVRAANGGIEVRGLAATPERKAELLAALEEVPYITVNIQTVEEATKALAAQPQVAANMRRDPGVAPHPAEETDARPSGTSMQEQLARYFAEYGAASLSKENRRARVGSEIVDLSNKAVSQSNLALAEAWALRRLCDRYGDNQANSLRAADKKKLQNILRDHATDLRAHLKSLRQTVEPPLTFLVGKGAAHGDGAEDAEWTKQCVAVFATTKRISELTHGLFANMNSSVALPEQSMRYLLTAIIRLEDEITRLEAAITDIAVTAPE